MRPHTAAARRRGIHYDVLELLLRFSELLWSPTATVRTSSHYKGVPMHAHYAVSRGHDHHELEQQLRSSDIPHFKEVIIMATSCDYCGHRTNEVKSGGGVEEKGVRIEVRVAGPQDFSRDLLKSETCSMEIPELELEVGGRALGGRFSTAEGALAATRDQLRACPGLLGDAPGLNPRALREFTEKLDAVLRGEFPVTIILDDPAGNSYAQSLADDPEEPDDGLKITFYERTFEQNEELGLNDMQTENYKTDEHEQHDASDKSEQHEQSDKSDQPDR
ncbi:zinc finger protein ZPR1-like [Trichoplusia ni]|uniref:Zinc finger protein ZPR1-like n=1 Tax=Trichoplusia ni TaxID=7111 RepID=A0A7E5X0X7_TRINI|nr:zinc finger protein ZPR1-like [Trichoplusia ni]